MFCVFNERARYAAETRTQKARVRFRPECLTNIFEKNMEKVWGKNMVKRAATTATATTATATTAATTAAANSNHSSSNSNDSKDSSSNSNHSSYSSNNINNNKATLLFQTAMLNWEEEEDAIVPVQTERHAQKSHPSVEITTEEREKKKKIMGERERETNAPHKWRTANFARPHPPRRTNENEKKKSWENSLCHFHRHYTTHDTTI